MVDPVTAGAAVVTGFKLVKQSVDFIKQNQTQPSMQTAMFDPNTNRQGVYKALFPDEDIGELLATRGIQRG